MSNRIYENLRLYFPFIEEEAENIKDCGDTLIITMKDGRTVLYDDLYKSIRNLPSDPSQATEEQCNAEFIHRLRRIMHRKGVTQGMLAEMTGISERTINRYLNGASQPNFYNIDKIARALDCSIDELRYLG